MKTYWDYSNKERSELTEERVTELLDYELMALGVLKPKPPVLEEIDPVKLETRRLYKIKHGSGHDFDVLFARAEDALAVAGMEIYRDAYDYQTARSCAESATGCSVEAVDVADQAAKMALTQALVSERAKKQRNEKLTSDFNTAVEKCKQSCKAIWEDWHNCRSEAFDNQRVIDTFDEYKRMTDGSDALAMKFLRKAFPDGQIADAFAWFGKSVPEENPPMPAMKAPEQQ